MPIDTSFLSEPFANLTLDGKRGNFLIDTGATQSQVNGHAYGVPEGSTISLSGFSLPSVQGGTFIAADLNSFGIDRGGELGVVGTDFLSLLSIEFHYEQPNPFAVLDWKPCEATTLHRAGFVEIGLPGYYGADLSRLKRGTPNVPVISLRVGEVAFPAQVDSGFGDSSPQGVIQVNAALMRTLRATGMPAHPVPAHVATADCSGTHHYERWQIEQDELSIVTPDGMIVASFPPPLLEIKTDAGCGGISSFYEPFAQIGASWLSRWGRSVFDGKSSSVWVPAATPAPGAMRR